MFKCEFCKNNYTSKSILNQHKKTAKKCLVLRPSSEIVYFNCTKCEYKTTTKYNISNHNNTCKLKDIKINYEDQIKELKIQVEKSNILLEERQYTIFRLENEIKDFKQQLKDNFNLIASKPTVINTTNNTRINNLLVADFKESTIRDKVENNFTLEYLNEGIKGVAKFTKDHIINAENGKHKYICSDPSRGVFKYKDENGIIQKDVRATKLKNAIKDPIITKSKTLFINENSRLFDDIANGDDNHINELMNEQITILKDNFLKVKNIDDNQLDYTKEMVLAMNE